MEWTQQERLALQARVFARREMHRAEIAAGRELSWLRQICLHVEEKLLTVYPPAATPSIRPVTPLQRKLAWATRRKRI